jgi:Fic family protein
MDKMEKLKLMDKILRELDDLKNTQISVLKKLSQIEADNINLGSTVLEKKLPDLHEEVDSGATIVTGLVEEFQQYRDKFFTDNKLGSLEDPTA